MAPRLNIGLSCLVCLAALCALSGCDTKNIGTRANPSRGPIVTVTVPADMCGGYDAVWTVTWEETTAPYSITMDLGGGATENVVHEENATSPWSHRFVMLNLSQTDTGNYTYSVTVLDGAGLGFTVTGPYTVGSGNSPPVIDEQLTRFYPQTRTLIVVASDFNGDSLYCTLGRAWVDPIDIPDSIPRPQEQVEDGIWTFIFDLRTLFGGIFAGGAGWIYVTVEDSCGAIDTCEVEISVDPITIPPDTLIATSLAGSVVTATPVTIVVATGVPANPFQFLNGVGVTIEDDAEYVANTFNAGVPSWDAGDVDGFWTDMNPGGGFLLPPDNFIQATDIGGGRERWDFNLTPIGGSDQTTAEGALFNFQFEFSVSGVKTLGFQAVTADTVKRTYYSDSTLTEYLWSDISNDGTVAPNSIEVL